MKVGSGPVTGGQVNPSCPSTHEIKKCPAILATYSKDIIPSEEDTIYWSHGVRPAPKEHSLLIWSPCLIVIPGEMSQFSESVCAFVVLQFKEMGLWSGIILGCLVLRYKKTDSRRKNIWNFNLKMYVCGVSPQEVGAIFHILSDRCHL